MTPNPVDDPACLSALLICYCFLATEAVQGQLLVLHSNPTTGFLTATTFIYALGAGITAAAGHYYHPSKLGP